MIEPELRPARLKWQKAERCGNSSCVEFARTAHGTWLVRDSKRPRRQPLEFDSAEWGAFVGAIRDGEICEDVG